MNSFPALDVTISIAFIMTFLCLLSTGIQEFISHVFDQRYKILRDGVSSLLHADDANHLVDQVFKHPLVTSLVRCTAADGVGKPSYLPATTFAQVVVSNLRQAAAAAGPGVATVESLINAAPNEELKKTLQSFVQSGETTVEGLEEKIAQHFDEAMERASGWYKRKAQTMLLVIGFVLSAALNTDLAAMPRRLYRDPVMRSQIVAAAEKQSGPITLDQMRASSESLDLPFGWHSKNDFPENTKAWALRIFGWLLTAAAISLGAPFWFDLLSRFVNLRSTKKTPTKRAQA